ncbi:aspartyl protease family protein [Sphingomonas sabuli]|uniref:Aspartyl protease family protein n=1 Tax=Sphingomonas sabuli TaxID=2764186 RepID=A0A7G9L1N7_9SPHN|nr:retroviral-like aspartic protease family protein [Sphingomonas sabuli]QNM82536.1 aspartyl protease family protein [Sphingomonas sabuli]
MRFGSLVLALIPALMIPATSVAQSPQIERPRTVPTNRLPDLPPAVIDDTLVIGGNDIAARKTSSRMTVDVHVNGTGPYRFIVDSGADTSVVGLNVARRLQMPVGAPAVLHGITETAEVSRVRVASLSLGPTVVPNLLLPALREDDLGGHGIIGIDALVRQRLMLDFEARTVKAEDASVPYRPLPGEIVVTALRRRGQLILTQVRAAGIPVDAVVDTGSEISIGNLALRDLLIRGNRDKFLTIPVTGVTGATTELQVAKIGELRLGSVTLRNVPIAFADVPPFTSFGLEKQPSLLLGTDLLETFRRVSLDFKSRKVRFQLRKCGTTAVILSTASTFWATRLSSGDNPEVCRR